MNKIEIDGVEYVPVDTPIVSRMDESCKECDIFKARKPLTMVQYPLCIENENKKVHTECCRLLNKGIHRIYKKVKK